MARGLQNPNQDGVYGSHLGRIVRMHETGSRGWCIPSSDCIQIDGQWYVVVKEHGSFSLVNVAVFAPLQLDCSWIYSRTCRSLFTDSFLHDAGGY